MADIERIDDVAYNSSDDDSVVSGITDGAQPQIIDFTGDPVPPLTIRVPTPKVEVQVIQGSHGITEQVERGDAIPPDEEVVEFVQLPPISVESDDESIESEGVHTVVS